jgi:predicted thioesterase
MSNTVETLVTEKNVASAAGGGLMPVFATPAMIADMERAASELMGRLAAPGQSSVGASISVEHKAASPIGARIVTTATVTAVDRNKVEFKVSSRDGAGEVGSGAHTRFMIEVAKFMEKAQRRK